MSQLHFSRPLGAEMSVDKIFEALPSAPRRRILAFLSKTDMTLDRSAAARVKRPYSGGHEFSLNDGHHRVHRST